SRKAARSSGVGGNPVRSRVARRNSVAFGASGENVNPLDSSLASRKASIGVRTRRAFFGLGTAERTGFRKAQKSRSFSLIGLTGPVAAAFRDAGSPPGIPPSIHF